MKYRPLKLILSIVFLINTIACNNARETPEDILKSLGLDEQSFRRLSVCSQIRVFAEVGYKFIDIDHGSVGNPSWMFDELRNHQAGITSACIKSQILEYISNIDQDQDLYKENSLKIHALIYLSESLNLVKNPDIVSILEIIVCDDQVELYQENFTVIYYLTQRDELPNYAITPEGLEIARKEVCT